MYYSKLLIPLLFLFSVVVLSAQESNIKFGKVSKEELAMTIYPKDSSASAVILHDKGDLNFDFAGNDHGIILEKHRRIKILKKAGFDYGD
ncbi:MAG: transglutaminase, partial [Bacteroidota bacterium]